MAFVEQHQDTPLADQLLKNWLFSLAKRGQWKTFLAHYSESGATETNACYHAYALYKNNLLKEAMALAQNLWLVEHSQPDSCDPIFKVWRDAGHLTPDLAWQRYSMALMANNVTLSNYLHRFLSKQDKLLASNFKLAHTKPRYITQTKRYSKNSGYITQVISHGIKRLARSDPDKALDTLKLYEDIHSFSQQELEDVYTYVAVRLARKPKSVHRLNQITVDVTSNQELVEAQLLTSLKQLKWSGALIYLHLLSDEIQQTNRWQYWKARILLGSEDFQDRQAANNIYAALAKERSFYGFMAADYLKQDYNFEDESISVSDEQILALEATPGIQRALELLVLNERTRARREWNFTTSEFSVRELQIAARVAKKWGWYEQAIRAMIQAAAWNDLDIRFPLAFHDSFIAGARTADIPVDWNLAIARQESAFMPDARSPVGALGIMQLMPTTAKQTANKAGLVSPSKSDLTDPYTSIRIGSAYLGQMLRRFNFNRILASAAYNAGPGRVESWRDESLPLDVWVETIPFSETRSYVMNVLMFSTIYSRKLHQKTPLIYDHERRFFSSQQVTTSQPSQPDNS